MDPLGGSWLVEKLTSQIMKEAMEQITEIEKLGGALKAIEEGYQQREIHNAAFTHLKDVREEKVNRWRKSWCYGRE